MGCSHVPKEGRMKDSAAVTGVISGYSTTADGCLRIKIDLNEFETVQFQERFQGIVKGMTVVVARMSDEPSSGC